MSFLKLGDLFTSGMTGNMVLLAIAIGGGHLLAASRSLCALVAFMLGVLLAKTVVHTLRRLLLLELVFLMAGAGLWSASSDGLSGVALYSVIALLALSMGLQATAASSGRYAGITTIVFTLTLVRVLNSPAHRGSTLPALAGFVLGAVLAALLISHYLVLAVWVPVAAVLGALALSELAGEKI